MKEVVLLEGLETLTTMRICRNPYYEGSSTTGLWVLKKTAS